MTKLSLALIVKNEARCLARCLESIRAIVEQIIVVDTGSTDDTLIIAQRYGAEISRFIWKDDFSAARNFALEHVTGDWTLVLDADEHASPALCIEIREFIRSKSAVGRLNIVSEFRRNGQILRSHTHVSRLFPKGARFEGRIHEQLVSPLPRFDLRSELWHDGYLENSKSDRNRKLLERELSQLPGSAYLLFQLALEHTSLGNSTEACRCLDQAYRTVRPEESCAANIIVDYLYALNELCQFEDALRIIDQSASRVDDFPDFHLACGLLYMNLVRSNSGKYISHLPKIELSFKRALALGETTKYKGVIGAGTFLAQYNLGTLYHVFGEAAGARECFGKAAALGYQPAVEMLKCL